MRNEISPSRSRNTMVRILALETWSAFLLPYGTPPVSQEHKQELHRELTALLARLEGDAPAPQLQVWLQVQAFPPDDTAQLVAQNGREWRPIMGLGIWPDREAPRTWRASDFTERDWGTPLPSLMDSVLHLSGDRDAAIHGWSTMFGTGSSLLMLLNDTVSSFYEKTRDRLTAHITDPALQHKIFYVPLLDAASVSTLRDALSDVLPDVKFYLRESKEDGGLLLILRTQSIPALVQARLLPEHS